jgi:uncharacterized 2Fe-2S/4Fe-4S cluster protein (DUF4445 family)
MSETEKFTVTFLPAGKKVTCAGGERLLAIARQHGVRIAADCGGAGRCHSCVVRIEGAMPAEAAASSGLSAEKVAAGWRLACQFRITSSCTIHVPVHTGATVVPLGQDDGPAVVPIQAPVLAPSQREGFWSRGEHQIGPIAGQRALGLSVDLGTTNIAAALIDMSSGRVVATGASENPQSIFGADVISRLTLAVRDSAAARDMQRAAVQAIAELASQLTGGSLESIAEVAVVGNSVMQHLLLGLPLDGLASAPYRPYILHDTDVLASDLGLKLAPGAWLYCGPNIAGFVGSDHVAALLETMVDPPPGRWALMDIGTNTEISVFDCGELHSASCASGPAFEGGMLSCGMRAGPGAVTGVRIENGKLNLETIGQTEAAGICGSGVVSLLSELVRSGAIDGRGRLSAAFPGVRDQAHKREFLLANHRENGALPVVFTQEDIRAVQLAKGAIRTGLELLLAATGVAEGAVDRLIIAGAFGKFLDVNAALAIGLLPPAFAGRIVQVGNAAGAGVRRLLVCRSAREKARSLALKAQYLELATQPGFRATFARRAAF